MQPYFFPYIGYFKLISSCDYFIFLDNVQYIERGWINRNNFLVNKEAMLFTVPVKKESQKLYINQRKISSLEYSKFLGKFYKAMCFSYSKCDFFEEVFCLLNSVLKKEEESISKLAIKSVIETCHYLNVEAHFLLASELISNEESLKLNLSDRIISLVKSCGTVYINNISGRELYNKKYFESHGVDLYFLEPNFQPYSQNCIDFIPFLSIVDILMTTGIDDVKNILNKYTLKK